MNLKLNENGLIPAIVQDADTNQVLMLAYMNEAAYRQTQSTRKVTFFSRSKQRLWVKGETSGNFLELVDIKNDCDNDALLVKAKPSGVVCHTGSQTCWGNDEGTLSYLERTIAARQSEPSDNSYVASLFKKGLNKIVQKMGEEAIEVIIEAKDDNDDLFLNESADLFFHFLILLQAKGFKMNDVLNVLEKRKDS